MSDAGEYPRTGWWMVEDKRPNTYVVGHRDRKYITVVGVNEDNAHFLAKRIVDASNSPDGYPMLTASEEADEITRLRGEVDQLKYELSLWRPEPTPTEQIDRFINER